MTTNATAGKPICDWDDRTARGDLVAELAADAYACLGVLDGRVLDVEVCEAAELLATVVGQDLETGDDGRPKVERKLAHLMRRRHGGRRARVRGTTKVDADFNLLAAATNLARPAVLGLHSTDSAWTVAG